MDKKFKVAYCKCGIRVSMVAALPQAETDKDIIKDFAKYAREGRKIDYITTTEAKEIFGGCPNGTCWKEVNSQLNLKME